jgi:MFS family permease
MPAAAVRFVPSMTTAAAAAPPAKAFSNLRHLGLAAFWFGLNFHWTPITGVLIPYQVIHLLPRGQQGTGIAVVTGAGAIFAVVLPPLVGAYSDRLRTRWGRRRPLMVLGTAANAVGLVVLMTASSYGALLIGYLIIQIFNNSAGAAFNAIVPDVVPEPEFGKASGLLGAMVQVGSVAGLVTTLVMSTVFGNITLTYGAMAFVILLTLVPTLWASRGEGMEPLPPRAPVPLATAVADFLRPLARGDFAWVIYTRTLITAGIFCVLPFLQLFFGDVVHVGNAANFTATWELVVLIAATPFGLFGGLLSDRIGRKVFVYASGALMTLVIIVFVVLYPNQQAFVLGAGVLFGVGYGLYYAVDWALACDTLPDRQRPAKDMGLFHVSFTLPQVFVPFVAGITLDAFNRQAANAGYRVIFGGAAAFYLLGTVFVSRIRSVR